MNPNVLWLIPGLPLLSFLVIVFFFIVGPARRASPRISGYIAILGIFGAWLLALWSVSVAASGTTLHAEVPWFSVGGVELTLGVTLDPLAAMMLFVVTTVSLLVQIYSQGYMHGDPGYRRYFAFISLFTTSMLGLVIADNLLQLYMFWELVGLCSYLLIGFWYQKPEAAAAAKKAFIVTRFGDFGFLIGLLILYTTTGTFTFEGLEAKVAEGVIAGTMLTIALLGLFSGAVGKSAQFPLHVWLPDAMEGPTPVSALIHAATMVAAGVYLVARTFPLFEHSPDALAVVAVVGGFTAIFAATHGIVMRDIKRVLAYSTISQLGYMMLGLGVGSLVGGVFHLFNHAFFKALLFLAAGSVIHGSGEQDLFRLGGLRKQMPWTAATFLVGGLALAGIFPFAGFWSKDEIIAATYHSGNMVLFAFAMITAFLTAFYISRAWILAFWGERRAPAVESTADASHSAHDAHGHGEAHESPLVMVLPLVLLAIPTALSGLLNSPWANGAFGGFLSPHEAVEEMDMSIAIASTVLALGGIGLGWLMYGAKVISAERLTATFRPIYTLLENRYYMDRLYENVIVRKGMIGVSYAIALFDKRVVDGAVNGVGWLFRNVIGYAVDRTESGRAPNYALSIFAGVVVIAVAVIANQLGVL